MSEYSGSSIEATPNGLLEEEKKNKELNGQKRINNYFNLDQPICEEEQDCLDRLPFVKAINACINHWNTKENFTIALCGPWGIGKTSIKNLIVNALKKEDQFDLVQFNPSELHDSNSIILEFFKTLLEAFNRQLHAQMTNSLLKYALRASGALQKIDSGPTKMMSGILRFLTSPFRSTEKSIYALRQEKPEESLGVLKEEIFKEIHQLKKPIVFIIDDIDRLNKEQMKLLFSLIKSNADFPKVLYLLLFDHNVASQVLKEIDPGQNGDEYLKKFIQVFLDVPPIDPHFLQQHFFQGVERITKHLDLTLSSDDIHQLQQLQPYFLPFFQTIRDIKRYFNSLRFHLNLLKNLHSMEFNIAERVILEIIRIFENRVYRSLLTDVTFKPTRIGGPLIISHQTEIALEYASDLRKVHVKKLLDFLCHSSREEPLQLARPNQE